MRHVTIEIRLFDASGYCYDNYSLKVSSKHAEDIKEQTLYDKHTDSYITHQYVDQQRMIKEIRFRS